MPGIKTRCMFCPMQDAFYVEELKRTENPVFGRESILNVEFDPDSDRGLCARGNFCQELSLHAKRQYRARLNGEYVSLGKTINDLKDSLGNLSGERIAILLDGSITLEEGMNAIALAKELNTNLVSLAPAEDLAVGGFINTTTFDKIKDAETNFVIGDIFTTHPTCTKLFHDSRLAARNNTMITLDTVKSRTGWFAHPELVSPLGKTADLLRDIIGVIGGKDISEVPLQEYGISGDDFGWAISALKNAAGDGNVVVGPAWHFADTYEITQLAKELAEVANLGFMVLPISTNSRGIYRLLSSAGLDITGAYKAITEGKLDALIGFDCDPVTSLGNIQIPEIFALTGQVPVDGLDKATHFIPTTFLFEKKGTILGTEEDLIKLGGEIKGPGVKSTGEIMTIISGKKSFDGNMKEIIENFVEPESSPVAKNALETGEIMAMGNGNVIHHSDGRYTRIMPFVNLRGVDEVFEVILPKGIAEKLSVENGDKIKISNKNAEVVLPVKIADWLDGYQILLPMHQPLARRLFHWGNSPSATPIAVKVEKDK